MAAKIKKSSKSFESYIDKINTQLPNKHLTVTESEEAFKSLKRNKASGYDDVNPNILIDVFEWIRAPVFDICRSSLQNSIFPDSLKLAKVFPIFKTGDKTTMGNYRPISILPVVSKLLERIMYNRVYAYLCENKLLFHKQFGFLKNTSTEHYGGPEVQHMFY